MKLRLVRAALLIGFTASIFLGAVTSAHAQTTQSRFAYVVNQDLDFAGSISGYNVDPATGALTPVPGSPFATGAVDQPVVVDPTNRFLYVPDSIEQRIFAYTIDPTTGALTAVSGSPFYVISGFQAGLPTFITMHPSGKFLYVTIKFSGIWAYSIDPTTGSLTLVPGSPFLKLGPAGPGPGITRPAFDPTGRFAFVQLIPSQGSSTLQGFSVDLNSGALAPVPGTPLATGPATSTFAVTIHPTGKFAYVANSSVGVFAFTIDPSTGGLAQISGSPFAVPIAISVTLDPAGKFAYVVVNSCGTDTPSGLVTAFSVDGSTGALSAISSFPAGACPQSMAVHPSGRFAYVVDSVQITGYSVDQTTGALTLIPGSPFLAGLNATSLTVDPGGRFLYEAATGASDVLAFSIDATTGALTAVPGSPFATSLDPQSVTLTAGPAVQVSSNLTVASTDPSSGVVITVSPSDNSGQSNGITQFILNYNDGAAVTLSAPATASGNNFSNWTGCDSTATLTCTVTMNTDRTVTANYGTSAVTQTLTVTSTNPISGVAITVNPSDNNALGNGTTQFARIYNNGVMVTLGAPATASGNNFTSWTGCDFTTGATCTVAMNANRAVTANFVAPPPSITSVAPTSGFQGQPISNFTVVGMNFQSAAVLSFSTTDIAVVSYSSRTATQIVASITIASNASLGVRNVTVTNPDSQQFTLPGAFTVLPVSSQILPPTPVGSAGTANNPQGTISEPISTGNGNYYYQHTDLMLPGRGMPLVFQRSYNSLDNYSGPLGTNWTHSYNIFLGQPASGLVVIKWGDGHGETFTLSGGVYVPQPGVFSTLVQNPNATFSLIRKDQTKFLFSTTGALTNIQDKNGNTIVLTHGAAGNLIQITDTVGRNLTLTYDASNRITQITDPIGRTVSFQYDASNNLTQATDPFGGITTFAYGGSHRVTSITQSNGTTLLQNTYDSSGRVISQAGGRGFSTTLTYNTPSAGSTTITDARGNQTIHTYDSSLRIVKITDAASGVTSFSYDMNNDRTSVTNQNGNTTAFAYVQAGNLALIADPLSETTAFSYDTKNDLLAATNAKGRTTSFIYDGNGNLAKIQDDLGNSTAFTYDGYGELISKTDARGNTTAYAYDGLGNLNRITDALSHSTTLAYDGIGRLTSITDPNGHSATATYDALSRLTKIADPLSHQTQFAYDAVGNLLKITDANGHPTSYAYDATNNLVTVTDALSHVTGYSYDPNNNRTLFTNAKGNATNYAYDALNRLTKITDPLSFVTSYSYDAVGNVLAVTDAKGQTNKFTFDALNRLLTIVYADSKNVSYAYDPNGNRTSMADSHGTTTYSYDVLDRLTSVTNPGAAVVTYSYDPIGNRASLIYPDGKTVAYGYDALNRLAGVTDWLGRNTAYTYDAASNLTNTAYPNGAAMTFSYDAANRLLKVINSLKSSPSLVLTYTLDSVGNRLALNVNGVKTNYTYDALNELLGAQLGPLKTALAYDAVGNRVKQSFPPISTTYTYDADDRMLNAGAAKYSYDPNGNQISISKNVIGQPVTYQYDAANRLIAATVGKTNSAFAYDGDGNRVSQSVGAGTYNYVNDVATALPVALQESGPDANINYAYGLGLISESSTKFDYFYHYDGLGSVIALTNASGAPSAAYVYDPWGNSLLSVPDSVGTKNKFRFTGEALDPGTGLYYLRARYYDPTAARFIGRDPFSGFIHSNSVSLNRYAYAANSPTNNLDPSGLWSLSDLVNQASDAVVAATSALTLSATTIAKGYVDTVAFVGGDAIAPIPGLHQVQAFLGKAQFAEAKVLNSSVAALEGVNLTPQEQQALANQVVEVTSIASYAVGLPNAITDISKIGFQNLNLFKVGTALTTIKQIYNLSDLVNGTIGLGDYILSGLSSSSTSNNAK